MKKFKKFKIKCPKSGSKNDTIYTVEEVDSKTNSAKLNINGKAVWVFSNCLYEISNS